MVWCLPGRASASRRGLGPPLRGKLPSIVTHLRYPHLALFVFVNVENGKFRDCY